MIAIVDYGVGNLFSLKSSVTAIGKDVMVASEPELLKKADRIILPGVGAFRDAALKLSESGMKEAVLEEVKAGKPMLGICLGMQLLFETDYEFGVHKGLGLIPGEVRAMSEIIAPELKLPQIGWNSLKFTDRKSRLYKGIKEGEYVYFVHSYSAVKCDSYVTALTEYSAPITASAEYENVCGTQYHPEKSGSVGLRILENFCTEF